MSALLLTWDDLGVSGPVVLPNVASTDTLTTYRLDQSRGRAAIDALNVLPGFTAAGETHADQQWPPQAIEALFGLNTATQDARDQGIALIPPEIAEPLPHAWRHAILVGLSGHPRRPGRKQSKTRNLLEHLRDREVQVLRFVHDLTVPFTNNQAERDLRRGSLGTASSANNLNSYSRFSIPGVTEATSDWPLEQHYIYADNNGRDIARKRISREAPVVKIHFSLFMLSSIAAAAILRSSSGLPQPK